MDEEQKQWYEHYSANFGVEESLRFGCVFLIWLLVGLGLSLWLSKISIFMIFLTVPLIFATVALRWQPAYSLFRLMLGNKNLPKEPMPPANKNSQRQPRPWWSYLPGVWWFLMALVLLLLVIKFYLE